MIVVDNTVLSNFARVGRFDLLRLAISELDPHITPAVEAEFREGVEAGVFVDNDLQWLLIAQLTDAEAVLCQKLAQELDLGEAESVTISLSRGWVLATDDLRARRQVKQAGRAVTGTVGILKIVVEDGLLSVSEGDRALTGMIQVGYFSPISSLTEVL
jgi:hypothetical protein